MKKTIKAPKTNKKKAYGLEVGKTYLFRGVTMYQIGTIQSIGEHEIALKPAAWVADTGRFNEALRSGVLSEVEPYPDAGPGEADAFVCRGAGADICPWRHGVPAEVR